MLGKVFSPWVLAALVAVASAAGAQAGPDADWQRNLAAWRANHEQRLKAPDGWLSLAGLDWLKPGDNSFGSAAGNVIVLRSQVPAHLGVLRLENDGVELLPPEGGVFPPELWVNGQAAAAQAKDTQKIKILSDASDHPSKITWKDVSFTVIQRGDRLGLRTKDPHSPARVGFHGLRWFPPAPNYRIWARWVPYQPPKQTTVPTMIGTEEKVEIPGAAEFVLEGQTFRLEPILESPNDKQLFFVFRDATSKTETYPAARFLYTPLPDHGLAQPGQILLDFNRAENPPCAYTDYATCPLPPKGNIMSVAIPAGQKRYHD